MGWVGTSGEAQYAALEILPSKLQALVLRLKFGGGNVDFTFFLPVLFT